MGSEQAESLAPEARKTNPISQENTWFLEASQSKKTNADRYDSFNASYHQNNVAACR